MSDILVHTEAGVMTLTFNRPDKKNSITGAMYARLADALEQAAQDAAVRVVVIQGQDTVFSAGNDIGDFLNPLPSGAKKGRLRNRLMRALKRIPAPVITALRGPAARIGTTFLLRDAPIYRFMRALRDFPKPVLAAVCGAAVGIGTTLLLHCDLVYAGENAVFSMPFVNLGLCPEFASSLLLPQMLGAHRAAEVLLLGEPFMAQTALEVGLANRVLPITEVNAYAQAQALKLAAKPLSALIETKRLLRKNQQQAVSGRMTEEIQSFARLLLSPAAREAFTAFMEKRKPDFSKY
ncbi:MAG: enoyl-CoA hydratase [Burkholderiaceae bacterium]|nr:enoyl-CoA hydratase [Burkholderiaceae bacterium]